jgi:hypothetical protein
VIKEPRKMKMKNTAENNNNDQDSYVCGRLHLNSIATVVVVVVIGAIHSSSRPFRVLPNPSIILGTPRSKKIVNGSSSRRGNA